MLLIMKNSIVYKFTIFLYINSKNMLQDRNHYGPSPDKLMTDAENFRTSIQIGLPGSSTESNFKKLFQASMEVEMNLSKVGNDTRRTRIGYKTKNKKKAFELMEQLAGNYNIHALVIERAKEE